MCPVGGIDPIGPIGVISSIGAIGPTDLSMLFGLLVIVPIGMYCLSYWAHW